MRKVIGLLCILILPFVFSCQEKSTEELSAQESDNNLAEDFTLTPLGGEKEVGLSRFKGKPVVINFWATWCTPCREEMPFLEKAWKEYKDQGLVLIGIDVLDDEKNAKSFLNTHEISYLNLKDSSGEVSNKYGVVGLPATFFIDREGRVVRKNYGPFLGEEGERKFMGYIEEIL